MCVIANANRNPKKRRRPFQPKEFHPYEIADRKRRMKAKGSADKKLGFKLLKAVFVDKKSMKQIEKEFGE